MDGVGHAGGARLGSRSYWYWWGFGCGAARKVTVEVTESSSTVFVEAAWRAAPRAAVALAGRGARAGGAGRSRGEKSKEGTLRSVGTAATGVVIAKIGWWEAVLFRFFPDCATALLRPDGNSLEGSQEYGVVWMVLRSPSESKNRKRPDAAGFSGRVFQVFKREGLILAAAAARQRALFNSAAAEIEPPTVVSEQFIRGLNFWQLSGKYVEEEEICDDYVEAVTKCGYQMAIMGINVGITATYGIENILLHSTQARGQGQPKLAKPRTTLRERKDASTKLSRIDNPNSSEFEECRNHRKLTGTWDFEGNIREAETEAVTEVRPSPPRFNLDEGAEELLVQSENSAHEREGDLQVASAVQDRFRQPEGRAACFRSLGVDQDVWEQQIPM
ncbi:hypothetical protein C8J57DRAFT_1246783 [Mycena rebaudengoi]|nr:hypothetical protein C8J57DRAFT_1246783 [Mycena rebaudengoi]